MAIDESSSGIDAGGKQAGARPAPKKAARPAPRKGDAAAQPAAKSPAPKEKPGAPAPKKLSKAPAEKQAEAADAAADDEEGEEEDNHAPRKRFLSGAAVRNSSAFFVSMVTHMVGILLLAMMVLPTIETPEIRQVTVNNNSTSEEDKLDTQETFDEMEAAASAVAVSSAASAIGEVGIFTEVTSPSALQSQSNSAITGGTEIGIEGPEMGIPGMATMMGEVPTGTKGEARAVVDGYDEAFDRITAEILQLMTESKVLVIWAFDQSESMKDDQQEIRDRVGQVYVELGIASATQGDSLATAVTSYGGNFLVHTPRPTSVVTEIHQAIDAVPIDATGKELMCQAVGRSIATFSQYAKAGNRRMALILVTDESGDQTDNQQFLEPCIQEAKANNCLIYTLGREAVFGYPYAHISWIHPQTGGHHWLQIDRGPETGFPEQLQTDGFRRRYDAHSSGFGPYEQARMSRETGGVFFMLPSVEAKLVRSGEKRRYELEMMRPYLPDLRSRQEIFYDRDASRLRTVLYTIINDLNPYRPEVAKIMEIDFDLPPQLDRFAVAANRELVKARLYIDYLMRAEKALEEIRPARDQEQSPRWQANYDLMYAQVLAYIARTYEYGVAVEAFMKNPQIVPATKPPNLRHTHWYIRLDLQVKGGDLAKSYIERSRAAFHQVIIDHPGTPWALRANIELKRGFGYTIKPGYHGPSPPRRPLKPGEVVIPVPKL